MIKEPSRTTENTAIFIDPFLVGGVCIVLDPGTIPVEFSTSGHTATYVFAKVSVCYIQCNYREVCDNKQLIMGD